LKERSFAKSAVRRTALHYQGDAIMSESNQGPEMTPQAPDDLIAKLKERLEETRLPENLKAQLLAAMPPLEERERLFRELQDTGGLSSEQFFASLGLEVEPQP
jgi:hypothetical protein